MSDEDPVPKGQFGNPHGEDGRKVLEAMNDHHVPLWDWCLSKMPKGMDGSVLDIGCGGGGFIKRMSERYPFAMFFGIDISEDALGMTLETNRAMYEEGGLELHLASVDDLPFDDSSFDLVTAMETYFFWPDLVKALEEVSRVVSPGGVFVIGSEMGVESSDDPYVSDSLRDYGTRLVPNDVLASMMDSAGFDVRMSTVSESRWAVFVGTKRF